MDIFIKNKLLTRLVIALILLNIAFIGYYFWQARKAGIPNENKRDFNSVSAILKRELQLSDKQVMELKLLRESFYEKETALSEFIKSQRDSMNQQLFNTPADTLQTIAIAKRVAENEYQMELLRIEQAQQLRSICTETQLVKFQQLTKEIRDYFQPNPKIEQKP